MNYSHHFHAGNFADVFKHIWLTRILLHLGVKETPFRYIETHAGSGYYDLSGPEAERTNEWQGGIGRLSSATWTPACRELLDTFLAAVGPIAAAGPRGYPGSPLIAQALLRPQDKMTLCELHPHHFQALRTNIGRDPRARAVNIDGYIGLNAFVPPKERRGLVLIDPPFEQPGEFKRLGVALERAYRKWPSGIFAVWYPLKQRHGDAALALAPQGVEKRLWIELRIDPGRDDQASGLQGCGLFLINPPHVLCGQSAVIMPELARAVAQKREGDWRVVT